MTSPGRRVVRSEPPVRPPSEGSGSFVKTKKSPKKPAVRIRSRTCRSGK